MWRPADDDEQALQYYRCPLRRSYTSEEIQFIIASDVGNARPGRAEDLANSRLLTPDFFPYLSLVNFNNCTCVASSRCTITSEKRFSSSYPS